MNTKLIPSVNTLVPKMPSGRAGHDPGGVPGGTSGNRGALAAATNAAVIRQKPTIPIDVMARTMARLRRIVVRHYLRPA